MPTITVQEMETQATEIMRVVREEQIAYEITENGRAVAVLSPAIAEEPGQVLPLDTGALTLLEQWIEEDDNDDDSLGDFLAFIEENRLNFNSTR